MIAGVKMENKKVGSVETHTNNILLVLEEVEKKLQSHDHRLSSIKERIYGSSGLNAAEGKMTTPDGFISNFKNITERIFILLEKNGDTISNIEEFV